MTELTLLFNVMAMVAGTAAGSWLAVGWPMQIAPRASLRFALANLLFLISVALTLQRGTASSFWFWPLADLFGILAIQILRSGTRQLFKQHITLLPDSLGFLLITVLYLLQPYDGRSSVFYGVMYSLVMAVVTGLIFYDVYRASRLEFKTQIALAIAWPFAAIAAAMLIRAGLIAVHAEAIDANASPMMIDNQFSMLAYAFLVLLLNVTLFGCVFTRLIAKLRNSSERDYLTGLLNRRAFEFRFGHERLRSERNGQEFSLVLFDIDHFKHINDRLGHHQGDQALRHVAQLLMDSLRQIDVLARFGGEEFIILLPDTPLSVAAQVAERLRSTLEQHPLQVAGATIPVQASFGCVSSHAGDNTLLLNLADRAMYRAKAMGRNRIELANAAIPTAIRETRNQTAPLSESVT